MVYINAMPIIYALKNSGNGKTFIGAANSTAYWNEMKRVLRSGKHHNLTLQEDWCTFGEQKFEFELLVTAVNKNKVGKLKERFIYEWMSEDPEHGYNVKRNKRHGTDTTS